MALVRSALCVTEAHGAERAAHMMHQVLIPALTARLDAEVAEKQRTLAEHEAKAADAAADVVVRQRANGAMASQTPYLAALTTVRPAIRKKQAGVTRGKAGSSVEAPEPKQPLNCIEAPSKKASSKI